MLGVRRNTVSVEAHSVQQAGLIQYRRGVSPSSTGTVSKSAPANVILSSVQRPISLWEPLSAEPAPGTCYLIGSVVRLFRRPSLKGGLSLLSRSAFGRKTPTSRLQS